MLCAVSMAARHGRFQLPNRKFSLSKSTSLTPSIILTQHSISFSFQFKSARSRSCHLIYNTSASHDPPSSFRHRNRIATVDLSRNPTTTIPLQPFLTARQARCNRTEPNEYSWKKGAAPDLPAQWRLWETFLTHRETRRSRVRKTGGRRQEVNGILDTWTISKLWKLSLIQELSLFS